MGFRRVTALLAGAVGAVCFPLLATGSSAATADTLHSVTTVADTGTDTANRLLTNCPITSAHGNGGAYICETTPVRVTWRNQFGAVVAIDDIVIGTDYRIYHDPGSGWRQLGNGAVTNFADPSTLGIFIVSNNTIKVLGTDFRHYCNTTVSPGNWAGWGVC